MSTDNGTELKIIHNRQGALFAATMLVLVIGVANFCYLFMIARTTNLLACEITWTQAHVGKLTKLISDETANDKQIDELRDRLAELTKKTRAIKGFAEFKANFASQAPEINPILPAPPSPWDVKTTRQNSAK